MQTQLLGQPCRNFQILGIGSFTDPIDGQEKVVVSNFAAGGTGTLVVINPATGEGEDIALPGDSGAYAVLQLAERKVADWNLRHLRVSALSGPGDARVG